MTQESVNFLISKLPMWETYKQVQIIPHLPVEDSQRLLSIAREIDPKYSGVIWCQSCLEDVVKFVFNNFTQSEEYKALSVPEEEKMIRIEKINRKKK